MTPSKHENEIRGNEIRLMVVTAALVFLCSVATFTTGFVVGKKMETEQERYEFIQRDTLIWRANKLTGEIELAPKANTSLSIAGEYE